MLSFQDVFERHAALSLEKQLALGDVIGNAPWLIDLQAATITFGEHITFPIQMLGTESEADQTWLWAWANTASNLPAHVLQAALQLRDLGVQKGIAEFAEPMLKLERVSGHQLGLAATGVLHGDCYYRAPYAGGAAYVLLHAPVVRHQSASSMRISNVFTQLVALFDVEHRRVLTAYLRAKGYSIADTGATIVGTATDGNVIRAAFDEHDRVAHLKTTMQP